MTHVRGGGTLGGNGGALQVGAVCGRGRAGRRRSQERHATRQETTLQRAKRDVVVTTTRGQRRAQHTALARTHPSSSPGVVTPPFACTAALTFWARVL